MPTGGCHCGAVRYETADEFLHNTVCHCTDCRRASGAPMVGWIGYKSDAVQVTKGAAKVRHSAEHARRHFCADCGTGLFYTNQEFLPGTIDVQTATFDDPEALPPGAHIQYAEHLRWTETLSDLPKFERYPG